MVKILYQNRYPDIAHHYYILYSVNVWWRKSLTITGGLLNFTPQILTMSKVNKKEFAKVLLTKSL